MRWFGENDPVPIEYVKMAGVSGIVSSLHHIPIGDAWSIDEIVKRKKLIESHGLRWDVVESIPVHEDIKVRDGNFREYIDNYKDTLRNLGQCGIHIVCYNFMPLLDWTRTNLRFPYEDGSLALAFDWRDLAVFDIYIHKRSGAEHGYSQLEAGEISEYFRGLEPKKLAEIEDNILKGLPGAEPSYTLETFRASFDRFKKLDRNALRRNLILFLQDIIPTAEKNNLRLAIHPDDPPMPLFGLPRVVSKEEDLAFIFASVDSIANGFTFCSGSLGVERENDLPGMVHRLGDRLYFIHLRNIKRLGCRSFVESNHLDGDVDMKAVVKNILHLMTIRRESIPMRPDHGHQMLDDLGKLNINPGYTAIGRMRGLAELRGLQCGLLD